MTFGTVVCGQLHTTHPGQQPPADSVVLYTDVLSPLGVHGVDTHRCTRTAQTGCPECGRNLCTECAPAHPATCPASEVKVA